RTEDGNDEHGRPCKIAVAPTFRPDIEIEADVVEEIARLYGYDKIEPTLSGGAPTVGRKNQKQVMTGIVKDCMTALGFCEAMTYTFESPKAFERLLIPEGNPLRRTVNIVNPLGEDFSVMRTQTVNAMLTSLSTNYNRRNPDAALFEAAKVYIPAEKGQLPDEINTLTIGMYGAGDFYALKGALCEMFIHLGINGLEFTRETALPYCHPGRTARVGKDGADFGWLGEIHPQVMENYEIGERTYMAVIDLDKVFSVATLGRAYKPLPKFPAIERDIAVIVGEAVEIGAIGKVITDNGGAFLESAALFDVYRGAQAGIGRKSVAYRLVFRAAERTLKDDEATEAVERILNELKENFGAALR
ncbi:MAG: phenylalanine--tRNA ligase subunit beta, partial [Defluviitaleaceae bacterium]|nr:phenylalanine--tRNA ligase subunit beta [Defluviitaleaceae bacterium]